ncbi:MAG: hypothetical protein IH991_15155 [Planctomycetes bacterium]|nr:hypothetical protein [Planctomycetota bacterium]
MIVRSIQVSAFLSVLLFTGQAAIAQDEEKPFFIQSEQLIIAKVTDTNDFLAYGKELGKWTKHSFPDGVTAVPVVGNDVCAFSLKGDKVAVDRAGNWRPFKLPMATATHCVPIISDTLAVYSVDGHVHAFSAILGRWHSVVAKTVPSVGKDTVLLVTADRIAVFSAQTAKWAVANTTKKKGESARTPPAHFEVALFVAWPPGPRFLRFCCSAQCSRPEQA